MKQSAFSRPPCRLIWYALVPLSLIFAFCFFLNGAIADEEPSLWETAVVSNPNPQDRLNLREQPSEAAASLANTTTALWCKSIKICKMVGYM